MAKLELGASPTSVVLRVKLLDSSVTTGAGLTGLAYDSAGLIISTIQIGEATATAYTQAGGTIETISTLGTYAAPTATKCRFKEVDSTNHKGVYEIQIANARFASTNSLIVSISGATNLAQCDIEIDCRDRNASIADAVWDEALTAATHNVATSAGRRLRNLEDTEVLVEEATAQGGAAGTITLEAGASALDDFYNMSVLIIVSGTGVGQARTITDYNGTSKVATVCTNWVTTPDATSVYVIRGNACVGVYGMNSSVYALINAEVDTALNTAIPASPTADSINDYIMRMKYDLINKKEITEASGTTLIYDDTNTLFATITNAYTSDSTTTTRLKLE
jgi:hypothetical protein